VRRSDRGLIEKLRNHERSLESHLKKASEFLVKCQIIEPYVEKGMLHGCVCPWEIGESADDGMFPILEDYHDTLESIWVWSLYSKLGRGLSFKPNIDWAWTYIIRNWKRFIGKENRKDKSLYDCSYVLFSGIMFGTVFDDSRYEGQLMQAGNRLAEYLGTPGSIEGREYFDPFWMVHCLELAAKKLKQKRWRKVAETFVENTLVHVKNPFSSVAEEPVHEGPGGHDFFSKNANMALALMSCFGHKRTAGEILSTKFLPCVPAKFVLRHVDENAWNAHLAAALGKAYVLTGNEEFLRRFFVIMNELASRDAGKSAALSRSSSFSRRESWVTFFYAHAHASVMKGPTD
jgi:hypothetical protein